jgi:hypothetical protein
VSNLGKATVLSENGSHTIRLAQHLRVGHHRFEFLKASVALFELISDFHNNTNSKRENRHRPIEAICDGFRILIARANFTLKRGSGSGSYFFLADFFAGCRDAYVPAANLLWNFSMRPAVSTNLSLPV